MNSLKYILFGHLIVKFFKRIYFFEGYCYIDIKVVVLKFAIREQQMAKIQLSSRMYSILDINRLLENNELSIQPKYQRRTSPWPINAKTALIDTIFNNFPIPPIYLRDYVDETGRRKKEIIDGQQRITIIIEYFRNKFALSKNLSVDELINYKYEELPPEKKLLFEDFEISFIAIRGASDSDIISIFSRLNSFSLPLNTQEKRNSKFAGEIKTVIYELASEYNTFWIDNKILSANQIARMADALLVSDIIYTMLNGYQSAVNKSINNMYEQYDEEFPYKTEIYKSFNEIISILGYFFESDHIRNAFKAKFMFYSLFLVLYKNLYGFKNENRPVHRKIDIYKSYNKIEEFSIKFLQKDWNPELKLRFKQATGNYGQRVYRHEEIEKHIIFK